MEIILYLTTTILDYEKQKYDYIYIEYTLLLHFNKINFNIYDFINLLYNHNLFSLIKKIYPSINFTNFKETKYIR